MPATSTRQDNHEQHRRVVEAARDFRRRGWKPIPILFDKKHPEGREMTGWQHEEHQFRLWHGNIGVQFGSVSNGLCDVDLDSKEARELAKYFLPETGAIFGRKSSPDSHWLYRSDLWEQVRTATTQFEDIEARDDDEHGVMLVELRTGAMNKKGEVKGAQSMVPPSVHPSGERVCWKNNTADPAAVAGEELLRCVSELAAATLLVRHYPNEGQRHKAALVLGGFLARAGWNADKIADFTDAVAECAHDPERQERGRTAASAVAKLKRGDKIAGTPRMIELFGAAVVARLRDWLELGDATDPAPSPATAPVAVRTIDEVLGTFKRWLKLDDLTAVYAMLGSIAANRLPGDPIWLGLIASPSSAKTELLNATAQLAEVVLSATLTVPALLSGTPIKQRAKGAKGGLLRQIDEYGILVVKDFSSILEMRPDARGEVMAALREIYDGQWVRHLGSDGGITLEWKGKMGLLFAATEVIDQYYSVIGSMGDRFLLCRLPRSDGKEQFERALDHKGEKTKIMRAELAEAVSGLFAGELRQPRELSQEDIQYFDKVLRLVVRLRGHVARDRTSKEIIAVHNPEGTPRLGLMLERLLAGLDAIGLDRATAFKVVTTVAYQSAPPQRLAAYRYLRRACDCNPADTRQIAQALGLPTATLRRCLEDLVAQGVVERIKQGEGHPDLWRTWKMGGIDR